VGGTGQTGQDTERGEHTHWKGQTLGLLRMRGKSEHARCTLTGEDNDGTVLMLLREDWSENRKKTSHSPVGEGRGRDWSGQSRHVDFRSNLMRLRTQDVRKRSEEFISSNTTCDHM